MKSFFVMLMCARAAAALTVAEVQDNIRQQDRQIECVSFEYSQETRSSLSPEVVRVSGEAYFKKPNSLRVEQIKPERQLIVGSGKSVHLYTPRFNQVLRDSWKAWSRKNSFLPGLFGSSGTLERLKNTLGGHSAVATIYKGENSRVAPDFFLRVKHEWVVFPWETEQTSRYDETI